jgi:methionine synthase II (cobalamin-independent)
MIQTEPIGSIPRPPALLAAMRAYAQQRCTQEEMKAAYDDALHQTIAELDATGSPVITDGEQAEASFATYPLQGLTTLSADGAIITFADGHQRRLPRLTGGPFRYGTYADGYVLAARRHAHAPIKHAVISVSALSPLYSRIETAEEVRDRVLEAVSFIAIHQLRTTDDCRISPFGETCTPREVAFAKIRARIGGTAMAARQLGIGGAP